MLSSELDEMWKRVDESSEAHHKRLFGSPLNRAMLMLADAGAIFLGQGVAVDGVAVYKDFEGVPENQRIEFPVAEELQLGASTGLALQGFLVVSVFPRFDFLLRAMDQLVNHLDKMEKMSCGQFKPKVIIRTRVGSKTPLDAGPQHTGNYAMPLKLVLTNVEVACPSSEENAVGYYRRALERDYSTIVVEAF